MKLALSLEDSVTGILYLCFIKSKTLTSDIVPEKVCDIMEMRGHRKKK